MLLNNPKVFKPFTSCSLWFFVSIVLRLLDLEEHAEGTTSTTKFNSRMKRFSCIAFLLLLLQVVSQSQKKASNLVYVDKQGVMRYTKDKTEAAFFGVNYTVPFAYGYRSHKALGVDLEKAIDADVYHMARLGLDAFRVHVWDVEITDSLGNLLQNEHLRLFDYLISRLKEHNIKILITPIAFWGNGYPEPDEKLPGFSAVYGKGPSVVKEEAIKAQENYLKQLFNHVNQYTKLRYTDDPNVIAVELNNEPHHSGPKERTTEYINRLTAAIKSVGWTKPVFYNISESPTYADAVVKSNVNGHSFQWYPTGLVAGHEQKGNFLPNVDQYTIPFGDTIAAFRNRAKAVYEFDAADVLQPIMYPAMARSFRAAGFQWATQFAYDPMATAYANTEYQTHYLNLAYTPSKAISLLIASKAFHRLQRGKSYGVYPADTLFDVFRVSYKEQLSEMNSEEEFYYSNTTTTIPKDVTKLKHIAGVGSSPVVKYEGSGAYFLDRKTEDVWRLEVMPDVIKMHDPFEKASLSKQVEKVQENANRIEIILPDFVAALSITPISGGNPKQLGSFNILSIRPGIYYFSKPGPGIYSVIGDVFHAPIMQPTETIVIHQPAIEVFFNQSFPISAKIIGIDSIDKVSIELRNTSNKWKTVTMQATSSYNYIATIPADIVTPGIINYRIMVHKSNGDTYTFPGGYKGDPYAWDAYHNDSYQTFVASPEAPLELFNPTTDRTTINLYNPDWRSNTAEYITADKPGQLVLKATMSKSSTNAIMGFHYFFGDKIMGRKGELSSFNTLVIRARATDGTKAKLSIITTDAQAFATTITLSNNFKEYEIPLSRLRKGSMLLLPRPYPSFQPLYFTSASIKPFSIVDAEKIEVSFSNGLVTDKPTSMEVESIWLKK